MINSALTFITTELNNYLVSTYRLRENAALLSNIVALDGSIALQEENKLAVSLFNIEQEKVVAHLGNYFVSASGAASAVNPPVCLNLYIMITACFKAGNYAEALKFISGAVSFFQGKNLFNHQNSPELPEEFDRLAVELVKNTPQDLSFIWGMLGVKYMPSVCYKIKLITIQQGIVTSQAPVISEPGTN